MTSTPFSSDVARHLVGGAWVEGGASRESFNPATGESLGSYFDADLAVATAAIDAAHGAFADSEWRHNRELRAAALWDMATAVEANIDDLALAISLENGKTVGQARFELSIAAPSSAISLVSP